MALFKIQQAVNMFDQNNEQAGISTLQTLLVQPKLPPFWRIHALALLAHSVDDWLEAKVSIPRVKSRVRGRLQWMKEQL